jgi:hypothetical protein
MIDINGLIKMLDQMVLLMFKLLKKLLLYLLINYLHIK